MKGIYLLIIIAIPAIAVVLLLAIVRDLVALIIESRTYSRIAKLALKRALDEQAIEQLSDFDTIVDLLKRYEPQSFSGNYRAHRIFSRYLEKVALTVAEGRLQAAFRLLKY